LEVRKNKHGEFNESDCIGTRHLKVNAAFIQKKCGKGEKTLGVENNGHYIG